MTDKEERIIEMLAFGTDDEIKRRKESAANFRPVETGELPDELTAFLQSASTDEDDYDYREDYVSEDDIARENGFYVDDDGHWRELPDDYDLW